MSPKVVDRENKRQEILMAAIHVFARQGVSKTKISDIASAAGIGKGTVYEYFKSKDEIFYESFLYFMHQINTNLEARINDIQDPATKLYAWIDSWLEAVSGSLEFVAIMMDYWAEGIRSRNKNSVFNLERIYDEYRQRIVGMIDAGIGDGAFRPVNSRLAAAILIGTLDGLMLQWIMNPRLFTAREVSDTLKKTFLEGLNNTQTK